MAKFLEYVPGDSLMHRMNPVAKVLCALLISIACFCTSNLVFLCAVLAIDFALAASCHMTKQALGLAKAVAIFSIILALIALLTTSTGTQLVALPWGYIGTGSILAAITVVIRLVACAVPLFLVMYVTQLNDLANSFCKILHVPYKYAFTFTSAVHFIPVFMNDMSQIMQAQTARGVEFDCGFVKKIRLMAPLCVPLLISSVRKTNSAAIAAEVRGFNLRTRDSGFKEYPFTLVDVVCILACALLIVVAVALNVVLPGGTIFMNLLASF
ncbi:energy-coupling factor transporter transmembrane component T [Adlercreutzia sp. ZJ304]|uniref:energy-coupling factor transporter transmembrane component T family protein n=1 Tax=Adlercreutzia sp. ZJ304 TaxID=2709791 RepID=UPI0013EBF159|nr:energy-coupling factor transporter transmembrane component T [Adlercreutzia sp. ZJ304]